MASSFEFACDSMVGAAECCDSAIEVMEFILSFREGGGSLPGNLSLPLPLPLPLGVLTPGVAVVLPLLPPLRGLAGSNFGRLDTSLAVSAQSVSSEELETCARSCCRHARLRTLGLLGLLILELLEILDILLELGGFLVLHQVAVVFFLVSVGLAFIRLLLCWHQILPVLADQFRDLGEAEVLTLEVFSHL